MKKLLSGLAVVAAVFTTGCTITDGSAIVTGIARDPIPVEQVRIYREAPANYEEVAMISGSAGHDFRSNSVLIEAAVQTLKEEAAKLGANGVLLGGLKERDTPRTSQTWGNVNAHASDGSSVYASGNAFRVDRGDSYTHVKGLAIFVPKSGE